MKIALLAPPYLPVPPNQYGGTEKIVSLLAEGLVKKGHDVRLFASGDSKTTVHLDSFLEKSLGNSGLTKAEYLLPMLHIAYCFRKQANFDIIHNHAQYLGLFFAEYATTPIVHTWHGTIYEGEVPESKRMTLRQYKNQNYISISNSQRQGLPHLNYVATVYNAINLNQFPFKEQPAGDYLLWVGRINEKKGPLPAINVAKKLGMKLEMAAALDPIDQTYFDHIIKPELNSDLITFHQELEHEEIVSLYQNALCTLFPINWHEPFGLVMIESMACGTPVIAYNLASVKEIIVHGKTGFIVNKEKGVDGLSQAITNIKQLKRQNCRIHVEENFSTEQMVDGYIRVYEKILSSL